jgi:glycogen debranching enzyme
MFDFNPSFLVRIHPHRQNFHISRGRTVFQVGMDGLVAAGTIDGLFVSKTRLLSVHQYLMDGRPPRVNVAGNIKQHSWLGYYISSPPPVRGSDQDTNAGHLQDVSENTIELRVSRFAGEGMHEDLVLTNFSQRPTKFHFEIELDADFADQEELQGQRQQNGRLEREWRRNDNGLWELIFDYQAEHSYHHQGNKGTAHLHRSLTIRIEKSDSQPCFRNNRLGFSIDLSPRASWHACLNFVPVIEGKELLPPLHSNSFSKEGSPYDRLRDSFLEVATKFHAPASSKLTPVIVALLERAKEDLSALRLYDLDHREDAWVTAAGLPMYVALFGRDSLTAAWQAALIGPEMMCGTLAELPRWQGNEINDWRDEQPGRMLHEAQNSPLAKLRFNPRERSYGSNTTSAFFPVVVSELWHWTAKKDLIYPLIDPAMKAIQWLDTYAHLRGDRFYYYQTRSEQIGKNLGWKDSESAIVYEDGSQVDAPIATCEEQGFAYASKLQFAEVLWWAGKKEQARELFHQAEELKKRFNDAFWMESEGCFALALDSKGNQVRTISSNPGHCIATGIVEEALVKRVADRLFADDMFSGWGIRTLSSQNPAFNPYSYHRGSIWPVEHGSFAIGLMRYGLWGHLERMCRGLFEASAIFDFYRLPEVFSGHARDEAHPFPALYPRTNWPQAWSASAMFCLIQAMLGIYPYAPLNLLAVDPHLPDWFPEVTLENLRVGDSSVSLRFYREKNGESDYRVLDKRGSLHVIRQPSPWSLTADFGERLKDVVMSFVPGR